MKLLSDDEIEILLYDLKMIDMMEDENDQERKAIAFSRHCEIMDLFYFHDMAIKHEEAFELEEAMKKNLPVAA